MAPDLLFLKDTDGDDKADVRQRILHGLDSADTHHTANSFVLDPGGALYFQEGTFHHTQVESLYRRPVRLANAGVFRYEPLTHRFDVYISYPFANPHGHVFDRWGQDIVHDGTGAVPYHAALFSGYVEFPAKHPQPPTVYTQRTRPCPATEVLSSRHFPPENQGNLLVGNVIGVQGILQYKIADDGSSFAGTEVEPILQSSDPNFRPVDMEIGPDGALYFTDWQNPIIGHMQHNLRDPSRDRTHGRVYRVTCPGRPLLEPANIAGASLEQLLDLLKEPENRVRYRAKVELSGRDRREVMAALESWLQHLDPAHPDYEHHRLEALWLYQYHNVVNRPLLEQVLESPDFRARAAATRVLCYQRDRLPDSLARLKKLAADSHPRVRLEAVRAASFYSVPEAVEVAMISSDQPSDRYLDFVRGETIKSLEPVWKRALAEGQPIAGASDASMRMLISRIKTEELLKMNRSRAVYVELLARSRVRDEYRQEALSGLAKLDGKSELRVLLDVIVELDEAGEKEPVVYDLVRLLTGRSPDELSSVRDELKQMSQSAKRALVRQVSYVAMIMADGDVERVWEMANRSAASLQDLLAAIPLIPDPGAREALYPHVEPLLHSRNGDTERPLRRAAMNAMTSVRGRDPQTFKTLAHFIRYGLDQPAAIHAIQRIPRQDWPPEDALPLLQSIVAYVQNIPAAQRTDAAALDALQLADTLASLLPLEEARKMRGELDELGVRVMRVGTLPHQMLYDKEHLAAQAGKPVEIHFENSDIMPHNLILARPGALEEIGLLAETTAQQPGAAERHYVPVSDKILLSSQLLQPGESQKLSFTAPAEPGVYPYVCTYPGHWRRMYGALYVVDDLDEYLANPEAYLARHPLAILDDLLKSTRPRTAWQFADLVPVVDPLDHGRSFHNGKQLFRLANCVACHRVNGEGFEFGPDLTKLDPKLQPADILRDILEPSARLNEKYFTYVLELESGKVVTGVVVAETPEAVKVVENPLAKAEPIELKRAEIVEQAKSPVSLMPSGLVDKLTREEILDLLAYVAARGDERHELFQGGHHHGNDE
jgi:putative heme-binding domain-containing protein